MGRGQQLANQRTVADRFSAIFGDRRGVRIIPPSPRLVLGKFFFTIFAPDEFDGPETKPRVSMYMSSPRAPEQPRLLTQFEFPDARRLVGMEIESAVIADKTPTIGGYLLSLEDAQSIRGWLDEHQGLHPDW